MEERISVKSHSKCRLQDNQQNFCWPPFVYVIVRNYRLVELNSPLGRNPDWIDLNIQYTVDIVKTGFLLGLLPKFLRP